MVVTSAKRPAILRAQIVNDAFVTFSHAASATAEESCANVADNDVLDDDHHCLLDDDVDAEAPKTVVAAAVTPSSYAYPGFVIRRSVLLTNFLLGNTYPYRTRDQ